MDMILMRHAAAADAAPGADDAARELTPEGRKAAGAALPVLKKHLHKGRDVIVWTSPALRAGQTARIVADGLNAEQVLDFSWIYTGEFDALTQNLSKAGKGAALIVVGHMPALSDWAFRLSGEQVAFEKGGMAGFALRDGAPGSARLLWLSRAALAGTPSPAAAGAGPLTLQACAGKLNGIMGTAGELARRFRKKPGSAKTAHQLRVKLRQGRSLLSLIKPAVSGMGYGDFQAALKEMAGRLSGKRETDVLVRRLSAYIRKNREGAAFRALLRALKRQGRKEQAALSEYFSSEAYSRTVKEISLRLCSWAGPGQEPGQFGRLAQMRFDSWGRGAAEALERLNPEKARQVHSLRIRLKKLLNAQALIPSLAGWDWMGQDERKPLENLLGKICDTYACAAVLDKIRAACGGKRLRKEADAFELRLLRRRKKLEGRLFALRGSIRERQAGDAAGRPKPESPRGASQYHTK